jgi:hypothetical protein
MFMRFVHLLKRAGREFAKNFVWMAVVFGSMAAFLAAASDLSLVGVMAFVGASVAVMAAIITVVLLWSGPAMRRPSVAMTTLGLLPTVERMIGPAAVGRVAEEETVAVGVAKAACIPIHLHGHSGCGGRSC